MIENGLMILLLLLALFFVYLAVPAACKYVLRARFLARTGGGPLFLTFDDGPAPGTTDRILAVLDRKRVRATFFLTGDNVERYPALARGIVERGHEVGEHGFMHVHPWTGSPLVQVRDALRMRRLVREGGVFHRRGFYRPPYGKFNIVNLLYLLLGKKTAAFWDIDPEDYRGHGAEEITDSVIRRLGLGSVILLHDGRPGGGEPGHAGTVEAVEMIIERARERGLAFATLGEAFPAGTGGASETPGW